MDDTRRHRKPKHSQDKKNIELAGKIFKEIDKHNLLKIYFQNLLKNWQIWSRTVIGWIYTLLDLATQHHTTNATIARNVTGIGTFYIKYCRDS